MPRTSRSALPAVLRGGLLAGLLVFGWDGRPAAAENRPAWARPGPSVGQIWPFNNSAVRNPRPKITGAWSAAAGEAGEADLAVAEIWLDGRDVTAIAALTPSGFCLDLPEGLELPEGIHLLSVAVADRAGRVARSRSAFAVDLTPPVIRAPLPAPEGFTCCGRPVISACWSDALSGVRQTGARMWLDGREVTSAATFLPGAAAYLAEADLFDGPHVVRLSVSDAAGNASTAEWTFYVDTAPPRVAEVLPGEGDRAGARRPVIRGRAVDFGSRVAAVEAALDGRPLSVALEAGRFSAAADRDLTEGSHELKVAVRDTAGNRTEKAFRFEADYTPPARPVVKPVRSGDRITIHGSAEPDVAEVVVVAEGVKIERAVRPEGFSVVFRSLPGGPESFSYSISLRDRAGNLGPPATGRLSFRPGTADQERGQ